MAVGDRHGKAATHHHHAERHDEGRQSADGDPQAVDRAHGRAGRQSGQDHQRDRYAALQQQRGHHGRHADDGPDREIDSGGQDDEGHRDAHDPEQCDLAGNVDEIERVQKGRGQDGRDDAQEKQGPHQSRCAQDRHPLRARVRCDMLHGRFHGLRPVSGSPEGGRPGARLLRRPCRAGSRSRRIA